MGVDQLFLTVFYVHTGHENASSLYLLVEFLDLGYQALPQYLGYFSLELPPPDIIY